MTALSEDDLTLLLREAASAYEVPEGGPGAVLAALPAAARPAPALPLTQRPVVRVLAAAAAAVVVVGLGASVIRTGPGPTSAGSAARSGPATGQSLGKPAPAAAPPALADKASPAASQGKGAASGPAAAADSALGRVVKTGQVTLSVAGGRVAPTVTALQQAATAQGGYVSASSTREAGEHPTASVTVRVPAARFEPLVTTVRSLGRVGSAAVSGRDVSGEYADVQAQIATLQAARSRFLDLLAKAGTIGEVLTVQQRVDDTTGQIDRLEGRRQLLAAQSDLSTLQVTVGEGDDAGLVAPPATGLGAAFRDAGSGFVTGVEALIRVSGRGVLVLLCLGALLLLGRWGWRFGRRLLV